MSEACPFRERVVIRYFRHVTPTLISCPTCGRCEVKDLSKLVQTVEEALKSVRSPARVAIMGCRVNGPGEAKEADIGVACGKERAALFEKGEIIKTIPADKILEELLERLPHLIVDEPPREPTRWLCWCDMASECLYAALYAPRACPCLPGLNREKYRQSCPHRQPLANPPTLGYDSPQRG